MGYASNVTFWNHSTFEYLIKFQEMLDSKVGMKSKLQHYLFEMQHFNEKDECRFDNHMESFLSDEVGILSKQIGSFLLSDLLSEPYSVLNIDQLNRTRLFGWAPVFGWLRDESYVANEKGEHQINEKNTQIGGGSGLGFQMYCQNALNVRQEVLIATAGGGGGGGISSFETTGELNYGGGGGGGIQYRHFKVIEGENMLSGRSENTSLGKELETIGLSDWHTIGGGGGCGVTTNMSCSSHQQVNFLQHGVDVVCGQSFDDSTVWMSSSDHHPDFVSTIEYCFHTLGNNIVIKGGGGGGGGGGGTNSEKCDVNIGYGFDFEMGYFHPLLVQGGISKSKSEVASNMILNTTSAGCQSKGSGNNCIWGCRCQNTKLQLKTYLASNCHFNESSYQHLKVSDCNTDVVPSLWNMYVAYSHIECPSCPSLSNSQNIDDNSGSIVSPHPSNTHCFSLSDNDVPSLYSTAVNDDIRSSVPSDILSSINSASSKLHKTTHTARYSILLFCSIVMFAIHRFRISRLRAHKHKQFKEFKVSVTEVDGIQQLPSSISNNMYGSITKTTLLPQKI